MKLTKLLFLIFTLASLSPLARASFDPETCADFLRKAAEARYPDPDGGSLVVAVGVEVVSADAHRITYDVSLSRKVGGCGAGFVRFVTDEDCRIVAEPGAK